MNDSSDSFEANSIEELIETALALSCEEDSDQYWSAVRTLQHRFDSSLLERMKAMIASKSEHERQFAADVVAQGRAKDKQFSPLCVELLLRALMEEQTPKVLASICYALGHHRAANAVDALAMLKSHADP